MTIVTMDVADRFRVVREPKAFLTVLYQVTEYPVVGGSKKPCQCERLRIRGLPQLCTGPTPSVGSS